MRPEIFEERSEALRRFAELAMETTRQLDMDDISDSEYVVVTDSPYLITTEEMDESLDDFNFVGKANGVPTEQMQDHDELRVMGHTA